MGKGKKRKQRKLTLSQFFERHFVPERLHAQQADPKTERSYRETINKHWVEITGDPPLKKIDGNAGMVANWITELAKVKGKKGPTLALSSLSKHRTQLKSVLAYAGHDGSGLIDRVPRVPVIKVEKSDSEKAWTIEEARALYDASHAATGPVIEGISPADWWKCLDVVAFYCGLRVNTLMQFSFDMIDGCWLRIPGSINKKKKAIVKYLPQEALEHIEKLRLPGRDKVLGWPGWPRTKTTSYNEFKKILVASGISKSRWQKYHGWRHTHTNELAIANAPNEAAMRTAQNSCGHSSIAITKAHYLTGTTKQRFEAQAVDRMRSPCGKAAADREALAMGEAS